MILASVFALPPVISTQTRRCSAREGISIMIRIHLIRWGGLAAILAGLLRGIASFTPTAASVGLQIFYLTIDVLLLLGAIDVYAFQRQETGRWGFMGFLLALIGAGLLL